MKKLRPLWKTNFSRYTTLPFGPKRFHHLKGPKNAPCLWLSQWQEIQIFNMVCLKIFRLKKLGVTSGFYLLKFYFVFDFGHFSPVCTSLTPPVTPSGHPLRSSPPVIPSSHLLPSPPPVNPFCNPLRKLPLATPSDNPLQNPIWQPPLLLLWSPPLVTPSSNLLRHTVCSHGTLW